MAAVGSSGDGGRGGGRDRDEDDRDDRRRKWGHYYEKLYEAKNARKKQIRRLAGRARARLNSELREQIRLIRRAARADLREDIRRLAARREEHEDRARGLVARDGNNDQRGVRVNNIPDRQLADIENNVFQRVPNREVESGSEYRDRNLRGNDRNIDHSGEGVHRIPDDQEENLDVFRRVRDENGRDYIALDGSRVWSRDPRIRSLQEQVQQQELQAQRTVDYVRRIRQEYMQQGSSQQVQPQQNGQPQRQQDQQQQGHHRQQDQQQQDHHPQHHRQQHGIVPQNQHSGSGSQEHHQVRQPSHSQSNQAGPSCQVQEEVRCDLTRARSFTLVIERTESHIWMVYTTHLEVLQLFFDRRLVPENNFFGVPADDLYDILSLSDVGHNGHLMTIMSGTIIWSSDGGEIWRRV